MSAFTLIELLVVIAIIIILMGLLFPAFKGAQTQGKRTVAKNDLTQLVAAVNAYYTEYGKYPLPAGSDEDYTYSYDGAASPSNAELIKIFQNDPSKGADNPRGIIFFSGAIAKSIGTYGIQPAGASTPSAFLDPWGRAYSVCIDWDYNGKVRERGTGNLLTFGVIAWSLGEAGDWDKSGIASWK